MHSKKNHQKIKLLFCGTPDFASSSLKSLLDDNRFEIVGIITQPDKKVGRKQLLSPPDVKKTALENGYKKIYQPENKKDLENLILKFKKENLEFDFLVVIAYGMILSEKVLNSPKIASINVHGSLLPKHRGASPIQTAILEGDKNTGISIMKMERKMDAGPIYKKHQIKIEENDTGGRLFEKLAELSAKVLGDDLHKIYHLGVEKTPWTDQDHQQASYCKKINKEDGEINWNDDSESIFNKIRAYNPWPIAYSFFHDQKSGKSKKIKIFEAYYEIKKDLQNKKYKIGEIILENKKLKISTKNGFILPKKLQPEGKKPLEVEDFINGYL